MCIRAFCFVLRSNQYLVEGRKKWTKKKKNKTMNWWVTDRLWFFFFFSIDIFFLWSNPDLLLHITLIEDNDVCFVTGASSISKCTPESSKVSSVLVLIFLFFQFHSIFYRKKIYFISVLGEDNNWHINILVSCSCINVFDQVWSPLMMSSWIKI